MNAFNLLQRCNALQVRVGRTRLACRCVAVVGALVLSLTVLGAPQAAAIEVTNTNDSGEGSLRQALSNAESNPAITDITFAPSLTSQTISLTSGELVIATNLTITGLGAGNLAISGNSASRVFVVLEGVTATIQEVTIRNGHSTDVHDAGGGIFNEGTLTVSHSTISGNTAGDAGGGIASVGTLTVSDSLFSGNSVTETPNSTLAGGGGIAAAGTLTVTNSTFSGNSVIEHPDPQSDNSFGGGILFVGDTLTVHNSTFSGNSVTNTSNPSFSGGGGGIGAAGPLTGTLTVTNSTFSGNSVTNNSNSGFLSGGGGILFLGGMLTVTNSTFSGNSVTNTSNPSFSGGGGIANFEGTLTLANTILANSLSGGDCLNDGGTLTPAGVNLVEDGSCGASTDPTHFLTGDPQLGPLAPNGGPTQTHALLVGSPAIDAANNSFCLDTDQRGVARPQGTACDIGAYERDVGMQLTALSPAKVWVGLKNSDAVGLRLDLKAEVFVSSNDNSPIGMGVLPNVPSGSSGFNNALLNTIPLELTADPVDLAAGGQLLLRVSVRRTCFGGGHNSGTPRLWYNGQPTDSGAGRDAGSRFDATIDGSPDDYYLRPGFVLDTEPGPSRTFVDTPVNSGVACPDRPFMSFGTWATAP